MRMRITMHRTRTRMSAPVWKSNNRRTTPGTCPLPWCRGKQATAKAHRCGKLKITRRVEFGRLKSARRSQTRGKEGPYLPFVKQSKKQCYNAQARIYSGRDCRLFQYGGIIRPGPPWLQTKKSRQGRYLLAHREEVLQELTGKIKTGTFTVKDYREREIVEGGKCDVSRYSP